jgi:hypothetical protein
VGQASLPDILIHLTTQTIIPKESREHPCHSERSVESLGTGSPRRPRLGVCLCHFDHCGEISIDLNVGQASLPDILIALPAHVRCPEVEGGNTQLILFAIKSSLEFQTGRKSYRTQCYLQDYL